MSKHLQWNVQVVLEEYSKVTFAREIKANNRVEMSPSLKQTQNIKDIALCLC